MESSKLRLPQQRARGYSAPKQSQVGNSMSLEDRITFQISFPFWSAYLATLQIILRAPLQLAVSAVFPAWAIYLIYLWLWTTPHYPVGVGDVAIAIGCFFFTPLVTALSLFLARRRNPLAKGPFTYTFDSDGIHVSGDAFEMKLKWPAIRKVRESGSFIFFFTASARAQCVPLARVRATGQLDDLRQLVTRCVANLPAGAG